ncbi:Uncharacterized protein HZ326_8449 [Fusarium oxysporum f. sp. albedinis]|nr:Uncharacterized protein HZ326_8449 [Fusarium oxysporum f. sp. albedinis]
MHARIVLLNYCLPTVGNGLHSSERYIGQEPLNTSLAKVSNEAKFVVGISFSDLGHETHQCNCTKFRDTMNPLSGIIQLFTSGASSRTISPPNTEGLGL